MKAETFEKLIVVTMLLILVAVVISIINAYLSCDGVLLRTLFWFECLEAANNE